MVDDSKTGNKDCKEDSKLAEKRSAGGETWNTCTFTVDNQTGGTIGWIAISHVAGSQTDSTLWLDVGTGIYSSSLTVNFSTGLDADIDYWYVVCGFDSNGYVWGQDSALLLGINNTPLICNLTSSDAGGTGYIRLYSFSSAECVPPVSSNCTFSMNNSSVSPL